MIRPTIPALLALLLISCESAASRRVAETPPESPAPQPAAASSSTPTVVQSDTVHVQQAPRESVEVIGGSDDESSPPVDDSTVFKCTPKTLRATDTLVITLKVPHGGYLTVNSPNDMAYNLVSVRADSLGRWRSIVPSDAFKDMAVFKVPATVMWPPYYFGKDTIPERVFRLPGNYVFFMGDNLNTDYGPPPFMCTVSFAP